MKLSLAVCQSHGRCRYLGEKDGQDWCHKLVPEERAVIDEEVKAALSCDFDYTKLPLGDNCPGVDNKGGWLAWLFKD